MFRTKASALFILSVPLPAAVAPTNAIDSHLLKSVDFTAVDLTGATKAQALAIQEHVGSRFTGSLAKELRDKIMLLED